jgi:hypothetical protein
MPPHPKQWSQEVTWKSKGLFTRPISEASAFCFAVIFPYTKKALTNAKSDLHVNRL